MDKKVLVTGSSGQIGSYVVDVLSRECEVAGLDLLPDADRTQMLGGVADYPHLELRGFDAVVHCAAQVMVPRSVTHPLEDASSNILGTLNMLEAARTCNARFIYISSAAVYGEPVKVPIDEEHPTNPTSPYGLSKLVGERYCSLYHELHELKVNVVRPFNVFSPRQKGGVVKVFADRICNGEAPVIFGDGEQVRDFVHAQDVARLISLLINDGPDFGTFNCCSGTGMSMNDLAQRMIDHFNFNGNVIHKPAASGDISVSIGDPSRSQRIGFSLENPLDKYIEGLEGCY